MMQMDFFNFGIRVLDPISVPKESRGSFILIEFNTLDHSEGDCQCPSELVV